MRRILWPGLGWAAFGIASGLAAGPVLRAAAAAAGLEPCRLPKLDEPALCGTLDVFEDRVARKGRKIPLHVAVLPATGPAKVPDPLFVLQGGPGQGATRLAEFYGTTFKTLRRNREIVLVDQRGTGESNPLECDLHGDGTDLQRLLGPSFPVADVKACRERLAPKANLALYATPMAMDDLDEVRAWLGYERINIYGTSYGTIAVQEYLRRYGPRVRSAVLKAVVAPSRDWGAFHGRNTQQALDHLFEACSADAACGRPYPELRKDLASVLRRLKDRPAVVEVRTPRGEKATLQLSRSAAAAGLRGLMAAPATAVRIPLITRQAAAGDLSGIAGAALQLRSSAAAELSEGMFLTVACSELGARLDLAALAPESERTLVGEDAMRELLAACSEWPRSPLPADYEQPLNVSTPVLLLSGRLDPSTPPESGEALLRDLPNGRHVVVKHGSHSFNNLVGCVDEIIAAFVAAGSAASLDASCADRIVLPPFAVPAPPAAPAP